MITIEMLKELVQEKQIVKIREIFSEKNIVDLSDLVDQLSEQEAMWIYRMLNTETSAELFSYLDSEKQEELIHAFTGQEQADILENLYTDDLVDLIEDLPANIQRKILKNVSKERRNEINQILNYKEYTAGSIMTTEYVELSIEDTCQAALNKIKKQRKEAETISYCYVIDNKRQLQGVVRLNEIVFAEPDMLVTDIMEENIISVNTHTDQEEVANIIKKYDMNVIPVVNDQYRLIGIITVDDILDVIEEETTEDIQKMNAVAPLETTYKKTKVLEMVKKRIVWLLILMITASITQIVMGNFEELLATAGLALFIPMLMDTGGNAGGQSSSLVIRALALNEISIKDYKIVLKKELMVSLICGVILAITNYLRIKLIPMLNPSNEVLLVLSLTLVLTVVIAKLIGGILPLIAKALNQDPAVMAGPLITTIVDSVCLLVYFLLASVFIGV